MYYDANKKFEGHGVMVEGVKVDLGKMMEQKQASVDGLTKGIEGLFKKNKVEYVKGWGSLAGACTRSCSGMQGICPMARCNSLVSRFISRNAIHVLQTME